MMVSGGRNGSVFLQSLLDGHEQILQLPGIFYIDEFLSACVLEDASKMCEVFIDKFPEFFDSRRNSIGGMDRLGNKKNEHIKVDKHFFCQKYIEIISAEAVNYLNIVFALHYAYALACGDNYIVKKRLLLIHIHHAHRLVSLDQFIGKYKILFMERDPIPSLVSEVKGWKLYYGESVPIWLYAYAINRKILEPIRITKVGMPVITIRLEDLHRQHKKILSKFCLEYGLDYSNSLNESSFLSLKWWGDDLSQKPQNGFNQNFRNNFDRNDFYRWELSLIEGVLAERIAKYGYTSRSPNLLRNRWLFLLPGKIETSIFAIHLRALFLGSIKSKIRALKNLPYLWSVLRLKRELIYSLADHDRRLLSSMYNNLL